MKKPIWVANNLYVNVYPCDSAGEPTDTTPLFEYCFLENCSLYGGVNWVQRPGYGNPIRNIESEDEWDLYSMSVGHFYFSKREIDRTNVFNRDAYLYLEMWLFSEDGIKEDEIHVLKAARAGNVRLQFRDNNSGEGEASFVAPFYEQLLAPPLFLQS